MYQYIQDKTTDRISLYFQLVSNDQWCDIRGSTRQSKRSTIFPTRWKLNGKDTFADETKYTTIRTFRLIIQQVMIVVHIFAKQTITLALPLVTVFIYVKSVCIK